MSTTYQGGDVYRLRRNVTLSNIDLAPDPSELRVTMKIPNGTQVRIKDAPAIDCKWQDGEIVKIVDNSVVSSLADVTFESGKSSGRMWLIAANIIVIVVIVAVLIYRRVTAERMA